MGDSLEARISIVEQIQKEFEHDLQEIKGQLDRLIQLIERHTRIMLENIHESPSFPPQPTLPPFIHQQNPGRGSQIPIRGNVPLRVYHPNWQPHAPTPAIFSAFGKVSQPVDLASSSENNFVKPRRNQGKKRWDPIPVTYTELLPRLLERQLVALSHIPPIKPPFPKSYNPNVHCDYHMGIPGHSTEDCICLKNQVQTLIEVGKINFENSSRPSNLSLNLSGARTEEKIRYTPEKMEKEKKTSKLQKENEKLQRLVQDMAYMVTEQKESIAALRGGV